jgi:hypothetical protein
MLETTTNFSYKSPFKERSEIVKIWASLIFYPLVIITGVVTSYLEESKFSWEEIKFISIILLFLVLLQAVFSMFKVYSVNITQQGINKEYLIFKWRNKKLYSKDILAIEFLPNWHRGEDHQLIIYTKNKKVIRIDAYHKKVYLPLLKALNQLDKPFYIREMPLHKRQEERLKEFFEEIQNNEIQYNDEVYSSFLTAFPKAKQGFW